MSHTAQENSANHLPLTSEPRSTTKAAVLKPSDPIPESVQAVHGIDFDNHRHAPITVEAMVAGLSNMGFQASAVADAVRVVDDMVGEFREFTNFVPLGCDLTLFYLIDLCLFYALSLMVGLANVARPRNSCQNHDFPWLYFKSYIFRLA